MGTAMPVRVKLSCLVMIMTAACIVVWVMLYAEHAFGKKRFLLMLFCQIPKIGCSNWRRVLLVLTGHVKKSDMIHVRPHTPRYISLLPVLNRFNQTSIRYRLRHYFKVIFVRDPLERLLSAWRNKFESNSPTSVAFRRKVVREILKQDNGSQRVNFNRKLVDKLKIPFERFLRFILDTVKTQRLNEHWQFYHKLCSPCSVHYDFVGRFETVERDAAHVLKSVNAVDEVSYPERSLTYKHQPSSQYVDEYYRNVSVPVLKEIYALYQPDYFLFNYSLPDHLKNLITV